MVINGKNYNLKYNLRTMFVFEQLSGKPFEIKTLLDSYLLCYACIISHSDQSLEFSDFIDYCEEHHEVIEEFNQFINSELSKRNMFRDDEVKKKSS